VAKDVSDLGQTREIVIRLRAELERLSELVDYLKIKEIKYSAAVEEARHKAPVDLTEIKALEDQSAVNSAKLMELTLKLEQLRLAIAAAQKSSEGTAKPASPEPSRPLESGNPPVNQG
jgi:hypothetical protein